MRTGGMTGSVNAAVAAVAASDEARVVVALEVEGSLHLFRRE